VPIVREGGMRDNNEQQTVADAIDFDTYDADHDPDLLVYYSEPTIVPDHGRQPRRPPRPTATVYRLDPHNRYRPADDPYLASTQEGYDQRRAEEHRLARERKIAEERKIARWLSAAARQHAPKLSWRRNDAAIGEAIEHGVMSEARAITSWLPPAASARVLAEFRKELWDQIDLNRKK
jgi:hypothetical protein